MNNKEEMTVPQEGTNKKNLVKSAKEFMAGALSPLKGRDIAQMVETFTSEMTLVAEGLSEDQAKLQNQQDRMDSQLTEAEESLSEARKEIQSLKRQVTELEDSLARLEKSGKGKRADGLAGLLRQATWLAGILAGAWIITTLINFFKT